jgi:hypothetical protein
MHARLVCVTTVAMVAAVVLTACGGSSHQPAKNVAGKPAANPAATPEPGPGTPTTLDACTLVTKQEVATVLGEPIVEVRRYEGTYICWFGTAKAGFLQVQIRGDVGTTRENFESDIQIDKKYDTKVYPVSGVGDAAYYEISSLEQSLHVFKGSGYFALDFLENVKGQNGQTQPIPTVRTLALQAASRIV